MAEERRRRLNALPPHKRLTAAEFQSTKNTFQPGEWFHISLPSTLNDITTVNFGPAWLTNAFHAAGTLPLDISVVAITSFVELELQGDSAQGGAGQKAIMSVKYSKTRAELHERLFIKVPWPYDANPKWRTILSSNYGDGDGRELSVYVLAEDLLPVCIPRLYFADLCRETSNYILITECIEYGHGKILSKCGKYQDSRVKDVHEYYYALMKALARVAAADKQGAFEEVISSFVSGTTVRRSLPDNKARRLASQEWTTKMLDALSDRTKHLSLGYLRPGVCLRVAFSINRVCFALYCGNELG